MKTDLCLRGTSIEVMTAMRKRYRVLLLAALTALVVPVGFALSLESAPVATQLVYTGMLPGASAPPGRARQMNAGAAAARGDWLLFLHADTRLPDGWTAAIATAAEDPRAVAGCFRLALDSRASAARLIEWGVRLRVALFTLPYGD